MLKVSLNIIKGPDAGKIFQFFEADAFLVGRSKKAHLRLDPAADRYISRVHFLLEIRPPYCFVTDLNSANGTFVNGAKIIKAELKDGDEVRAGHTVMRVDILREDTERKVTVFCAVCRKNVTGELAGHSDEELNRMVYTCRHCRREEEVRERLIMEKAREAAHNEINILCSGCGADLTGEACSDGRAHELRDAAYLCAACADKRVESGLPETGGMYRLLEELGRGAMGVVYKVVHEGTRRVCALKQLHSQSTVSEVSRRMFEREIDVQSKVIHPNLVRYLDKGNVGGVPFFVTEYLSGGDVKRLVKSVYRGPVDPPLAVKLMIQILSGLHALHERGFVHRDLKPSNFILNRPHDDPACQAKISDYGLAKSFEDAGNSIYGCTGTGQIGGSAVFMPPEQITNYKFVKPPSDVYAAGVSLYYLLSGKYTNDFASASEAVKLAEQGKRFRHELEIVLEDPPVPLIKRNPRIPIKLAMVVDKAVTKEVENRCQSAAEFREDLLKVTAEPGWVMQSLG
jgi:serine/threonine-protein kinase